MTDNHTGQAAPTDGAASPRERYDWMVAELVAVGDEMVAQYPHGSMLRNMISGIVLNIAEYVSATKGTGAFDSLLAIADRRGIDLDALRAQMRSELTEALR